MVAEKLARFEATAVQFPHCRLQQKALVLCFCFGVAAIGFKDPPVRDAVTFPNMLEVTRSGFLRSS
jgi:hypothetical protein